MLKIAVLTLILEKTLGKFCSRIGKTLIHTLWQINTKLCHETQMAQADRSLNQSAAIT